MISLLSLNTLLFLLKGSNTEILIFNQWSFSPYQNMLSTLILGSIFQLIVLISKEKALGQGDVRIAIITGLLIGFNNLIYWAYIAVFSALIYGLLIASKRKKFKNLKIPFVPFMVLGIITLILINL
jgi:leader peptidase (prepilin peptidase)/N-methyltransferase